MGDSLDDLDFPKCAEQLMAMPTMRRLGHKPLPLGAVKRWRFCFRLEDGQSMYIGTDGNLDSISEYIGTEPEARWESERRLIEFEKVTGTTPASVAYESQGKANATLHLPTEAQRKEVR